MHFVGRKKVTSLWFVRKAEWQYDTALGSNGQTRMPCTN